MEPLVLCAVADDEHGRDVVTAGRSLAAAGGVRTVFVHVAEPYVPPHAAALQPGVPAAALGGDGLDPAAAEETARENAVRVLRAAGVRDGDEVVVTRGRPADRLAQLAGELAAELLVVGTRGRGPLAAALLGSVTRTLARACGCPLLVARPGRTPGAAGPVVCGVECDDAATRAAAAAASRLARLLGRRLVLVHVVPTVAVAPGGVVPAVPGVAAADAEGPGRELLRTIAAGLDVEAPEQVVLEGAVPGALERLAESRGAALLVVGSHGGGLLRAVLAGTVSQTLTRDCEHPLVIAPARTA